MVQGCVVNDNDVVAWSCWNAMERSCEKSEECVLFSWRFRVHWYWFFCDYMSLKSRLWHLLLTKESWAWWDHFRVGRSTCFEVQSLVGGKTSFSQLFTTFQKLWDKDRDSKRWNKPANCRGFTEPISTCRLLNKRKKTSKFRGLALVEKDAAGWIGLDVTLARCSFPALVLHCEHRAARLFLSCSAHPECRLPFCVGKNTNSKPFPLLSVSTTVGSSVGPSGVICCMWDECQETEIIKLKKCAFYPSERVMQKWTHNCTLCCFEL